MIQKYDSYKSSGIEWLGDIPSHWEEIPIKAITQVKSIKNKPKEELLSVYRDYGVIIKSSRDDNHNKAGQDLTNYKLVEKTNLVLNKMKTWQGSLGVSEYKGIVSPAYIVCKIDTKRVFPKYLNHLLRCKNYIVEYNRLSYGVRTDQWDMRYDDFKNTPLFLPPKDEQEAIADFLDKRCEGVDKYILKQKELIELLKEKKSSLINKAVTKGLDSKVEYKDSGIEWLGEIPKHWEVKKLSRAFKNIGSGTTPTSSDSKYHNNGTINWINTGDLNDDDLYSCKNKITEYALKRVSSLKVYPKESLIIAMYGATIGKTSISKIEACVNQACCVLSNSDYFTVKFMFYSFIGHRRYIISLSYGGGQPNISQDTIKSLKFCCPPKQEQKLIVEYIERESSKIDKVITHIEDEIKLLQEYKQSLISSAVTGKIKVV